MAQKDFIQKVREINERRNSRPSAFLRTYGCQMNERDSEKIAGILKEMGYARAESEKDADFVIYNTCCVRENAENKIFGNLGRLKHYKSRRPDLRIALCGCMLQQDNIIEIIKSKYRFVDLIFGTFNIHRLPELLYANLTTNRPIIDIWKEHVEIEEDLPAERKFKWKAGINVMYGCDNFCSYCIVPYVRGRERSRETEEILKEAELFSKDGVKEILLLGQNVNSYGKNLKSPATFASLLEMLNDVSGIERIRFMTSHPMDFSDELIDAVAKLGKVCKHVHLPLQSGSTKVLANMNRGYTKQQYMSLAEKIKDRIPGVSITTDIIVGFPGEDENDFSDTLDVIKSIRFSGAFTFIYSKRTGTPAANMPQPDKYIVDKRFERLLELQNKIVYEENQRYVGKTVKLLVESTGIGKNGENPVVSGRTDGNTLVHFEGTDSLPGKLVDVEITKNRGFFLEGKLVSKEETNDSF